MTETRFAVVEVKMCEGCRAWLPLERFNTEKGVRASGEEYFYHRKQCKICRSKSRRPGPTAAALAAKAIKQGASFAFLHALKPTGGRI